MKNDRETKEIELFSDTNTEKTTKNVETPKEKEKKEDSNKGGGHSFYGKKKKKMSKKKKLWTAGILASVGAIGLSVGLGVGLGVNWGGSGSHIKFPYVPSEAELNKWLEKRIDPIQVRRDRLTDAAIIYWFDEFASEERWADKSGTPISPYLHSRTMRISEFQSDKEIRDEKDGFKTQYGGSWAKEWTKNLIELGYDSEKEYKESKIASKVQSEIIDLYVDNDKFVSTNDSNFIFKSNENNSSGQKTALYNDFGEDHVNIQDMYQLYLNVAKPVGVSSLDLSWTFGGDTQNEYDGSLIKFESYQSVIDAWIVFNNIVNEPTEFEDRMNKSLDGGIKRIGTAAANDNQVVEFNILSTLFDSNITTITHNDAETKVFATDLNDTLNTLSASNKEFTWKPNMTSVTTADKISLETWIAEDANALFEIGKEYKLNINNFLDPVKGKRSISRKITVNNNEYLMSFTKEGLTISNTHGLELKQTNTKSELKSAAIEYTVDDLNKKANPNFKPGSIDFAVLSDFDSWVTTNSDWLLLNEAMTEKEFVNKNFTSEDKITKDDILKNLYFKAYRSTFNPTMEKIFNAEDFLETNDLAYDSTQDTTLLKDSLLKEVSYFKININGNSWDAKSIKDLANSGNLGGTK